MKPGTVFFNGVEMTRPEAIKAALEHRERHRWNPPTLEELRAEMAAGHGTLPEDDGPDPLSRAITAAMLAVARREKLRAVLIEAGECPCGCGATLPCAGS